MSAYSGSEKMPIGLPKRTRKHLKKQTVTAQPPPTSICDQPGRGSDDTLFALADGKVCFERVGRDRKKVSIKQ